MKLPSYSATGTQTTLTVSEAVFGAEVNQVVLSQAVRVYRANLRQGTSKVKTRSEVARTKKKWFKQKGTGNARHGARTPNIFVGGGVSHGPTGDQNWMLSLPQKMKHAALVSALSAQAAHTMVHEAVEALSGQTKSAQALLNAVNLADQRVLIIASHLNEKALRSLRNLNTVLVMDATRVTALEVVSADAIILTPAAVTALTARLSGQEATEVKEVAVAKPAVKAAKSAKTAKTETKPAVKKAAAKKPVTKSTKTKKA